MDADLQHPPEINLALLSEMKRGADVTVASRNVAGGGVSSWSMARRILSRGAQLIGLLFLPEVFGRLSDPMSGYFMIRRSAISGVALDPLGYKILIEVMTRGSARWVAEVPYVFRERAEGDSKVTWKLYVEYIHHLIRLRMSTLTGTPFFRYVLVGLSGVAIDMGLLYVFSEPTMLGFGIARSKVLAAQPALLWTFFFHETWSFANVRKPREMSQVLRRLFAYYAVGTVGLFFAVVILSLLVEFAHLSQYLANAVGISVFASWNYWLHRKITWAESERTSPSDLNS
jgi:dolichol-phosphate mannosyltransferase